MNEPQLARNIKDILDASLGLSPEVVARLKVARERALERHRAPVGELVLAGAGRSNVRMGGLLTGDLPIKAYLDEDFQAWLKRSSE